MIDEQELEKRIDAANDKYVMDDDVEITTDEPIVDIYDDITKRARAEAKKMRPNGSSSIVRAVTKSVIEGDGAEGLLHAFKRAKDASDASVERGEVDRADLVRRQYMEERFLPAVETIIRFSSPDELLNCRSALSELDKCALGAGGMAGYTASYVRSAYGDLLGKNLNGSFGHSDPAVQKAVQNIKAAAGRDNYRAAIGAARQIKKMIDAGEHLASEADYSLIGRVAAYGR